jgi:hypothetical protein
MAMAGSDITASSYPPSLDQDFKQVQGPLLGWISNAGAIHLGEWRHLVRLRAGGSNDVFDRDSARRQRIGDRER